MRRSRVFQSSTFHRLRFESRVLLAPVRSSGVAARQGYWFMAI
ncbi:hypothetical protein ACKFKG_01160 [Phormidesmis sp. 146-35]